MTKIIIILCYLFGTVAAYGEIQKECPQTGALLKIGLSFTWPLMTSMRAAIWGVNPDAAGHLARCPS